jgi:hypothetical protein
MNSVVFIVLAFVYMYIGRKIGWVLSRNILYSASAAVTALLCVGWGVAVACSILALMALLDPNIIVKVIFGFLLGAYVAIPNYGLFAESSIPTAATGKHGMIGSLPVFAYVLTLLALVWLPALGLLLSVAFIGVAGVIFIAVVTDMGKRMKTGSPPPTPPTAGSSSARFTAVHRVVTQPPVMTPPPVPIQRSANVSACIRTIESELLKRALSDQEENKVAELCSGLLSMALGDEKIVIRLVKLEWPESTDPVDAFRRAQDRWQRDHNRFV